MHFTNALPFFISPNILEEQSPLRQKSPQKDQLIVYNPDTTCLYIGNIDKNVDNGQLTDLFKKFGELEYCFLVYEPSSSDRNREVKISRGYGFVKFIKIEDLVTAKNELDGFELNGRKIKIELSKRSKPRESTPGRYLGKKRDSPRKGYRHRGRSYSRSSSESYHRRRHYDRKEKQEKHRRHYDRSRSRDRGDDSRKRKRSYSYDKEPRRKD